MIEAQIICCEKCDIPDLGLNLVPGEEQWVSDVVARDSKDLQRAKVAGKVRVYRKTRRMSQTPKRPAPPFVLRSRPPARPHQDPQVVEKTVEVEKIVVQEVDTEKLKAELRGDLLGELLGDLLPGLRAVVAEEMGKAVAQQASQQASQQAQVPVPASAQGIDADELESVLEKVVRRVGVSTGGRDSRSSAGPEEPLFIPGKIVEKGKDMKGSISVKSTTSDEAGDVDEAQAALREMRRRAKKENQEK